MITTNEFIKNMEGMGLEFHQRFKGKSKNWLIFSKRSEKDYSFRAVRYFYAVEMNLCANPQEIAFEYVITRNALASQNVKNIIKNPEVYLAQSGLTRFKRFLKENDSVKSYPDCTLTSDSAKEEFKIPLIEDLDEELNRVRYGVLNILRENKYLGIKRTPKEDIEDRVCTDGKILDRVFLEYQESYLIDGAYGGTGIKITLNGEKKLDEIKKEITSHQGNSSILDGLGFGSHDWNKDRQR